MFQLLDSQEMHAESFVQFIQPSLEMAVRYNFTQDGTGKQTIQAYRYYIHRLRPVDIEC